MTRPLLLTLVVLTMLGTQSARAATLPADTTAILSGAPSLFDPLPAPLADSHLGAQAVSTDGRFVAFSSLSDGLSNEDNDAVENVYVKDRLTGAVTLASRRAGTAGAPADAECSQPAISDDGHRVAFSCVGPLDPADTNSSRDVYVRDLTTSQTFLASRSDGVNGVVGDDSSTVPVLDADGSRVAFDSRVPDLGEIAGVRGDNVYVRDLASSKTMLVNRAQGLGGVTSDGPAANPSISNDGDLVAFQSSAGNLVTGDNNNESDIFVRKLSTGDNTLASRKAGATGALGNDQSITPVISGDGSVVAFGSLASNLLATDLPNHASHIYRRSLGANTITLVDQVGGNRSSNAASPSIDDSGNVVAFGASGLDPADVGGAFYAAAVGGNPVIVNRADGPSGALLPPAIGQASLSPDGTKVAFPEQGQLAGEAVGVTGVAMRDRGTNTTTVVSSPATTMSDAGGQSFLDAVSADGRYAVLLTSAPALLPPGVQFGLVVRDTVTGSSVLASRADGPDGAPIAAGFTASISADGRRVAFDEINANGESRVWVRDLVAGTTVLASRADGASGEPADGFSAFTHISADGQRVEFLSSATDLSDADTDSDMDAYVRDLSNNTTILASRADGPTGDSANKDVADASLSADGQHVAFSTAADNLGDGDSDQITDVHVRDLAAGRTRLASVSSGGEKGDADSEVPSIDGDGQRVVFESAAGNLGVDSRDQVWLHDLGSGATTLVSRADGAEGDAGDDFSDSAAISADGRVVAFTSDAANLIPGFVPPDQEIYRRDLAAGTTKLVSRAQGPAGAPLKADADFTAGVITADGACVAFTAQDSLVNSAPGAEDFPNAYMRTFAPDCGRPPDNTTAHDSTAPLLRSVSLSRSRFRVAKGATVVAASKKKRQAKRARRGTTLRFTSSEAARLAIRIERVLPGRKSGKGRKRVCKPVRHKVKRGRCTAFRRTATLTRTIKAGPGRVALTGRIGKRRMAAGRYRLTLTARDAAGNTSKAIRRSFTIVPG